MVAVSIDGVLTKPDEASVSVFDRGLLYGDGCFEVLRTWDGVARELEAHLDRLYDTARHLALKTFDRGKLVEAVYRTIAAATIDHPPEYRIRIVLTRGAGSLVAPFRELGVGKAIVIVEPMPPQPIELSLAVIDWPVPKRPGRGHKTLAYLDHVYALELARLAGAHEAVRLDAQKNVVEGSTCNVFVVAGRTVATPAVEGILPGVVRARVLELCPHEQLTGIERPITLRDLRSADEVFVTSSLRGVVAVTRVDNTERAAGPITARLAAAYVRAMRAVM